MEHFWIKNADEIISKTGIEFFRYHPEFDGNCMDFFLMQPGAQLRVHFSFANKNDDSFWLKITRADFTDYKPDLTKIETLLDIRIDLSEFLVNPLEANLLKTVTGSFFPQRLEFLALIIAAIIPANFRHPSSTNLLFGKEEGNE